MLTNLEKVERFRYNPMGKYVQSDESGPLIRYLDAIAAATLDVLTAEKRGRAAERADVVAFLRTTRTSGGVAIRGTRRAVVAIARGDHVGSAAQRKKKES